MRIMVLIYGTHKNNSATVAASCNQYNHSELEPKTGGTQKKLTRGNSQIGMLWVCLRDLASTYKMESNQQRQQMSTLGLHSQACMDLLT